MVEVLDAQGKNDAIYTDISKAFDCIDNGIDLVCVLLAREYHKDQNCGPILYLLFINDLSQEINCQTLIFDDDVICIIYLYRYC